MTKTYSAFFIVDDELVLGMTFDNKKDVCSA
jgi:hypothetical protein